jgi:threonine dehydrogenase-like Zn-dependent dehydrogenase
MKALVFGQPPDPNELRPEGRDDSERLILSMPFGIHEVDPPVLPGAEWVILKPLIAGICGSDAKLVLGDFSEGDIDNPMAAFSSLPLVPGHEVVAVVEEVGPEVGGFEMGDRVVVDPWLTCQVRGVDPVCPACAAGDRSLCWSFRTGDIGPGVHLGVTTGGPGGWAEAMAAHFSMLHAVPDELSNEAAVLADPFSVSLHAIVRNPPPPTGRAVVYGAGALGLTSVAILSALYPEVEVAVVARFRHQGEMAKRFGASMVVAHQPAAAVVEELAHWSGGLLHKVPVGLAVAHPGGVDVVYDTVGKPDTFEVGVRVLTARGRLVYTGVATPGRWEWTPVYFKELSLIGSNAFGVEEVRGRRMHAIDHYLAMASSGEVDVSPMLTHRFPLESWWEALTTIAHADLTGAIKVAFEPGGSPA